MRALLLAALAACSVPDKSAPDAAAAPPQQPADHVTLDVTVVGPGTVTVEGLGTCADQCTYSVTARTQHALTATPENGHKELAGWTGACEGQPATCALTVVTETRVGARFE